MSDVTSKTFSKNNFFPQNKVIGLFLAKLKYRVSKGELSIESYLNIENNLINGFCNGDSILWGILSELNKKDEYYNTINNIIEGMAEEELSLYNESLPIPVDTVLAKPIVNSEKSSFNTDFDRFISWVQLTFNSSAIGIYGNAQPDIMHIFDILLKRKNPEVNEFLQNFDKVFNFAGVINKEGLEFLLKETIVQGGVINLSNHVHHIGIHKDKSGKFLACFRDSNGTSEINAGTEKELAEKILSCFFKEEAIADSSSFFPISLQIHGNSKKMHYRPMGHILNDMDDNGYLKYDETDCNSISIPDFIIDHPNNMQNSLSFAIRHHAHECMKWHKIKTKEKDIENFTNKPLTAAMEYGNLFATKLFSPKDTSSLKKALLAEVHSELNTLHFVCISVNGGDVNIFRFLMQKYPELLKDPEVLFAKSIEDCTFLEYAALRGHEQLVEELLTFISENLSEIIDDGDIIMDFVNLAFMTLYRATQQTANTETLDTVLRFLEKVDESKPGFMKHVLRMSYRNRSLLHFAASEKMQYAAIKILQYIAKYDSLSENVENISSCLKKAIEHDNYHLITSFVAELLKQEEIHEEKGFTLSIIKNNVHHLLFHQDIDLMLKFFMKHFDDIPQTFAVAISNSYKEGFFFNFAAIYNSIVPYLDTKEHELILMENIINLCVKNNDDILLQDFIKAMFSKDIELDYETAMQLLQKMTIKAIEEKKDIKLARKIFSLLKTTLDKNQAKENEKLLWNIMDAAYACKKTKVMRVIFYKLGSIFSSNNESNDLEDLVALTCCHFYDNKTLGDFSATYDLLCSIVYLDAIDESLLIAIMINMYTTAEKHELVGELLRHLDVNIEVEKFREAISSLIKTHKAEHSLKVLSSPVFKGFKFKSADKNTIIKEALSELTKAKESKAKGKENLDNFNHNRAMVASFANESTTKALEKTQEKTQEKAIAKNNQKLED